MRRGRRKRRRRSKRRRSSNRGSKRSESIDVRRKMRSLLKERTAAPPLHKSAPANQQNRH